MRALGAAAVAVVLVCSATAGGFIRPIIGVADPSVEGYSSSTTYGVCAGYYWAGSESRFTKEASLELGYTKWTTRGDVEGYDFRASEKYMPVMLNLRVHVGLEPSLSKVRFYFGPSLGLTQSKGSLHVDDGEDFFAAHVSDWSFCWGGTAGFVFQLTDKVDLDLGFRLLRLDGSDFSIDGETYASDSSNTKIWYAGLGYRF